MDIHNIVVEIAPKIEAGKAAVNAGLVQMETKGVATGQAIGRSFEQAFTKARDASGRFLSGAAKAYQSVGTEAEQSARKAAAAQEAMAKRAAASAREQSERLKAAYREIVGPAADFNRKLSEANALMRQGSISAQQYAAHVKRLQGDMRSFQSPKGGGSGGGGGMGLLPAGIVQYAAPAAAVAATLALGREVLQLGDSYQTLTNRLITLTGSEAAAVPLREKLLDLAVETRTENGSLVDLYTRIAGSVKELGVSERETIAFTEQLAKSFKVSGASTVAQQQAMVQLAQGLGAGALRGEEFNSVLEAAPNIIDIIGKSLGKTRGEMRAMAEAGAITTKQVMSAFAQAGDEIDAKFGKNVATTADLMVVLKNEIERSVGSLVQATGIVPLLADAFTAAGQAIRIVAADVKTLIRDIKDFDDEAGNIYSKAAKAAVKTTGMIVRGAYATTLPGVAGGIHRATSDGNLFDLVDAKKEADEEAAARAVSLEKTLGDQFNKSKEGVALLRDIQRGANAALSLGNDLRGAVGDQFNDAKQKQAATASKAAADAAAAERERALQGYEQLQAGLSSVYQAELQLANAEEVLAKAERAGFATKQEASAIYDALAFKIKGQLEPYATAIEKIEAETVALGLSAEARKRSADILAIENGLRAQGVKLTADEILQLELALDKQEAAVAAATDRQKLLENQRAVYNDVYGAGIKHQEMVAAATAEYERGALSLKQYNEYVAGLSQSAKTAGDSLAQMFERAGESGEGDAFTDLGERIGDVTNGFLEMAMEGKRSFGDLANELAVNVAKMMIQFALLQGAKSIFGAGSAPVEFLSGVFNGGNFAAGGGFTVPNGGGGTDSVPVFFRATPNERVTVSKPGQAPASAVAAAPIVPVTMINSVDPNMIVAAIDSPAGHSVIMNVLDRYAGMIQNRVGSSS